MVHCHCLFRDAGGSGMRQCGAFPHRAYARRDARAGPGAIPGTRALPRTGPLTGTRARALTGARAERRSTRRHDYA